MYYKKEITYYQKVQSMPDEWIDEEIEGLEKVEQNLKGHWLTCLYQEKNDRENAKKWEMRL